VLECLVPERNLAHNTQRSNRDAFMLLIPFVAGKPDQSVDRLTSVDLSANLVRSLPVEQARGCSIQTNNQRLATIHALARFAGESVREHINWCG
jgi:hypothetical protein